MTKSTSLCRKSVARFGCEGKQKKPPRAVLMLFFGSLLQFFWCNYEFILSLIAVCQNEAQQKA